jgi:hypothetical protein
MVVYLYACLGYAIEGKDATARDEKCEEIH